MRVFFIAILIFASSAICAYSAPIINNIEAVDATCLNNGKLIIDATNALKYGLKDYPSVGVTTQYSTNIIENLPAGNYIVIAYASDNSESIASITINSTYVPLNIYVSTDKNREVYCTGNGVINFYLETSSYPVTVTITDGTISKEKIVNSNTVRFDSLSAGNYKYTVEDNCGEIKENVPGVFVVVNSDPIIWKDLVVTNFDVQTDAVVMMSMTNCNTLEVNVVHNRVIVNSTNLGILPRIKMRIEYPANSGNFTEWDNPNIGIYSIHIENYDVGSDDKSYRLQIEHPCTKEIISTPIQTIWNNADYIVSSSINLAYCSDAAKPEIEISPVSRMGNEVNYTYCGTYTFTLKKGNTVLSEQTKTFANSMSQSVKFTKDDGLELNESYMVLVSDINNDTISRIPLEVAPPSNINVVHGTGRQNEFGGRGESCGNFDQGNYSLLQFSDTVMVSFLSPARYASRPPVKGIGSTLLTELELDETYQIKLDYGCGNRIMNFTLNQEVAGFNSDLSYTQTAVCGMYNVNIVGFFLDKLGSRLPTKMEPILIIIENKHTGQQYHRRFTLATIPVDLEVPGGDYIVRYTTNAANCDFAYTDEFSVPLETTVLNYALSGGITCQPTGKLLVSATGSEPLQYRYKKFEEPESDYSAFQSNNYFDNLVPGIYSVQVKNNCNSTYTYNIRLFDGSDQFITVNNSNSGIIEKGTEAILTTETIGPVDWYKWYYREDDTQAWTIITGADTSFYTINYVQESDAGEYMCEINNTSCNVISSTIKLIVVEAKDKMIRTFVCEKDTIDILNNLKPSSFTITTQGKYGVSSVLNNKFVYDNTGTTCDLSVNKIDTVVYNICVSGNCDDKTLLVGILQKPEVEIVNNCSFNPQMQLSLQYNDAIYKWEYNDNGTWITLSTSDICNANLSGDYRITLKYKEAKTVINKTITVEKVKVGNKWWYQLS